MTTRTSPGDLTGQDALPFRPRVIAHRGSSGDHPEHTIEAYRQAIADGADGLECDVRLTADGHLVCLHDRTVARTSDGHGAVSTLTLAQLRALDFGSWKTGRPAAVLELRELLELVRDAGRPLELFVETKHPNRHGGLVERRLVELLRHHGLPAPGRPRSVRVMSFSRLALVRLRRMAPGLPLAFLGNGVPLPHGGRLPAGAQAAAPSITAVRERPGSVRRLHDAGKEFYVWTVDEISDIELCIRLGVDAVITNRPRLVREMLDG
ncbi:glycerophosphodiester phosphodiesterase [Allostreptomyces psammosilenae]|uniref:Glycerophosphoryl diester phosphodiesterase n=1 Tax=Allostreptomyces psammosilenae TaxID=1892865 RepID=A0A853A4S6_9ACTN|nr:glycerophosphodiester phosphodiesterase family protein [Allostreptomyces psammosilenae]NYI05502.1 glycerophosphoryl diester phosphodiesterase [Allostreptomyces psammosilenae]